MNVFSSAAGEVDQNLTYATMHGLNDCTNAVGVDHSIIVFVAINQGIFFFENPQKKKRISSHFTSIRTAVIKGVEKA